MKPKYKAWHKKHRKVFHVEAIDFALNSVRHPDGDCFGAVVHGNFVPIEDIILLHLTGKRDKNGVEIHEGHLLKTPLIDSLWMVKFGEYQYNLAHSSMIGFYMESKETGEIMPLSEFERHEVVGAWV